MLAILLLGLIFGIVINYFSVGFCGAVYCTTKKINSYGFRMFLISILIGGTGIFFLKTLSGAEANYVGVMGIDYALMIGAFIFGIGMMLSDGCILGVVRDLGNGYLDHIITFLFVIIGTLIGNVTYKSTWLPLKEHSLYVYFPETFGTIVGFILFILLVVFIYFEFYVWDKRNLGENCRLPKKSIIGGIILGIYMIVYQLITGLNIGISGAFPYFGAWATNLFGAHSEEWSFFQLESSQKIISGGMFKYETSILIIGIIIGSMITAILTKKFKIHKPESIKEVGGYAAGGLFMGYGACIAAGCNLSVFLSSAANLSLSAWVYLPFMMLGSILVIKVFKL
ncbi:MAG: hypothetical protein DBY38_10995 [Clostridium cadaveris]|uniref:Uncharacterized protein n=1 Tax=Clostridium cadaveris TaxID=1529 RepID=A0A316M2V2_9CLOT|nr:MAG: hypothetical protein DBY38_10995 [Clostridium cadaveris]